MSGVVATVTASEMIVALRELSDINEELTVTIARLEQLVKDRNAQLAEANAKKE